MASTHVRKAKIAKYVERLNRRIDLFRQQRDECLDVHGRDSYRYGMFDGMAAALTDVVFELKDEFELKGEDEE